MKKTERNHQLIHNHFDRVNAKKTENNIRSCIYFPGAFALMIVTMATISMLIIRRSESNFHQNIKEGATLTMVVFLIISGLVLPNGPFIRPHPIVWRLVFGISVLYLLFLTFISFLHIDQIKTILHWLDPDIVRYAKKDAVLFETNALNCSSVTLHKVYAAFDFYSLGHFIGWASRALAIRSYLLCWSLSILWEFTELFFVDLFPDFPECWWDQVFIDVVLCNGLGIFVGMKLCKYFGLREYRWDSIKDVYPTTWKLGRISVQFTPHIQTDTTTITIKLLARKILGVFFIFLIVTVADLNTFFHKDFLHFPTTHPFCWGRLLILFAISAPSFRQLYRYLTDTTCQSFGTQTWISIACVVVESVISARFSYTKLQQIGLKKFTAWIIMLQLTTLAALAGFAYLAKLRNIKVKRTNASNNESCAERVDTHE